MLNPLAALCYVDGSKAYFTTAPLDKQWGDDWNDAPYEHNAGTPYETEGFALFMVHFDGPFETPADRAQGGNSAYSVEAINRGDIAWLSPSRWWVPKDKKVRPIPAGTPYPDFVRMIRESGGTVWEPID